MQILKILDKDFKIIMIGTINDPMEKMKIHACTDGKISALKKYELVKWKRKQLKSTVAKQCCNKIIQMKNVFDGLINTRIQPKEEPLSLRIYSCGLSKL